MGPGGELRIPMSVTVIFGLSVSTLLTLIVVPCFYYLVDDIKRLFPAKAAAPSQVSAHAEPTIAK